MAVDPFSVERLGEFVRERRLRENLSLRDAAAQAHVSFNTLGRVERGQVPDLATFMKLVSWLGLEPERFFMPQQRRSIPTPELVADLLRQDPDLPADAAQRLSSLLTELYANYARPRAELAVHLRAARTFDPAAAVLLTEIVETIQERLTTDANDHA
jgi:transcriptional regulator with XRE-family HTH domain